MARRFMREEVRKMLHKSVQRLVAAEGIENLTTRKITSGCELSDPYLYQCYDGIPDLLEGAFLEIDSELGRLLTSTITRIQFTSSNRVIFETNCKALWLTFWNFLMENADRTIYYWRFCQSGYCTAATNEKRKEHHKVWYRFVEEAAKRHNLDRHADVLLMLSSMVDSTLLSAVKVLQREVKENDNSLSTETVFRSVFAQIFSIFEAERLGAEGHNESHNRNTENGGRSHEKQRLSALKPRGVG